MKTFHQKRTQRAQARCQTFLSAQEELGVPITPDSNRKVAPDAEFVYWDASYYNPGLDFAMDKVIQEVADKLGWDIDHSGQNLENDVRTVTCVVGEPPEDPESVETVKTLLLDSGLEILIYTPGHHDPKLPIRHCLQNRHSIVPGIAFVG